MIWLSRWKQMWMALAGSVALVACGPTVPPTPGPVGLATAETIEVRMIGLKGEQYQAVRLSAGSLRVRDKDRILVSSLSSTARLMELSRGDHATLVGTVEWPADVETATVEIDFDGPGFYRRAGVEGMIDARRAKVRFVARRAELMQRQHAVIELLLEDSLVGRPDGRLLLPKAVITY